MMEAALSEAYRHDLPVMKLMSDAYNSNTAKTELARSRMYMVVRVKEKNKRLEEETPVYGATVIRYGLGIYIHANNNSQTP